MKSVKLTLLLLLLSGYSFISLHAQENTTHFLHTVEKGQNLYSISSMYNVSIAEIIRLNPDSEKKIFAGQTLKIPQKIKTNQAVFHTIIPGENLYRLSMAYNISVKELCDENPGLSAENFKAGEVIRIPLAADQDMLVAAQGDNTQQRAEVKPRCKEMHKVKRKETIFSVSRQYGLTEQELIQENPELKDGMKKGQLLCIPYPATTYQPTDRKIEYVVPPSNKDLFIQNQESEQSIPTIKAAIILPFLVQGERKNDAMRMMEYYEGFLLSVDSLKRKGVSIDLYAYDSGNESSSISHILSKPEMKQMNIIFGPLYKQHIKPLSSFANTHNIRLVVPIIKDDEVFQNPLIYQVNTAQSYVYSEVYEHFTRQFTNANVIVVDMKTDEDDKKEFIDGLKQELERKRVSVQTVNGTTLSLTELKAVMKNGMDNVFVPTSGSAVTLNKIIPQLKMLIRDNPAHRINLFGYPEWQTYLNDNLESFFELNTYFYSSFYTSNLLPAAKAFNQTYRRWYSKEMQSNYPKYGMLGFDTGLFFLTGLAKYGTGLEQHISDLDMTPVQTGFKFERANNWGGFVNKKVFFIHFTREFELVKLDFD